MLADYIGPHKILWATDYPHPTASSRRAKLIADRPELSPETKRPILAAARWGSTSSDLGNSEGGSAPFDASPDSGLRRRSRRSNGGFFDRLLD